jgi:murein DD-endopeptidase MepM/ murein hydrolase activator NlpD
MGRREFAVKPTTQKATRRFVATIAATLALLLTAVPAFADPNDDQTRVEHELEQTRAALETASAQVEAAAEAFTEANARLPGLQQALADAQGVLAGAKARQATAAKAVAQAGSDLAAAGVVANSAAQAVDSTRDAIGQFAAASFMGRDVAGMQVMLSADDPAGFVTGLTYLDYVSAAQRRALDRYSQAKVDARNAENVQAGFKRVADQAKSEADGALFQATQAEAQAAQAQAEVAAMVAQRQQSLQVAEQLRSDTEARYAELQAESERIAAAVRALAAGGGPTFTAGRLPMPVNGWKSSDFGMRYDPFYNVWQLHAGVDLAAPGGTPIWAAETGDVFRAGWNGGYGNYTCIYHGLYQGQGFATCYAHQSQILVSVGQHVERGQVIGLVGTTGASTGTHLHFEVRLDGTPVDPLPWLPSCLC